MNWQANANFVRIVLRGGWHLQSASSGRARPQAQLRSRPAQRAFDLVSPRAEWRMDAARRRLREHPLQSAQPDQLPATSRT